MLFWCLLNRVGIFVVLVVQLAVQDASAFQPRQPRQPQQRRRRPRRPRQYFGRTTTSAFSLEPFGASDKIETRTTTVLGADFSSEDSTAAAPASLDATTRLPTSVDDQVRQAILSLQRASQDGKQHRHLVRLLLPVIGATDLDDWPGGARQMMEAAYPLVTSILQGLTKTITTTRTTTISTVDDDTSVLATAKETTATGECSSWLLDDSEGVYALMAQGAQAKDDVCAVVLPTAELVPQLQELETSQVGPTRDFVLVNPQWKRRSDFNERRRKSRSGSGGFGWSSLFGGSVGGSDDDDDEKANPQANVSPSRYIESTYEPTFSLTNLIVEGENIRILRTYPGPWRVFVRKEGPSSMEDDGGSGMVDWVQVGQQNIVLQKPVNWEQEEDNQRDGGQLFNFGIPSYAEVVDMLNNSPNYVPKNPAERAMAAFNFIKDSL